MRHSDAYIGAKVELKFIERHFASMDRELAMQYTILDNPNRPAVKQCIGVFPSFRSTIGFSSKAPAANNTMEVTVMFPNLDKVSGVSLVAGDLTSDTIIG